MGHIIDKSKGGNDTSSNLKAICANCNEGLQNAGSPKPDTIQLLSQIRRGTIESQLSVLDWLNKKYGNLKK